MRDLIDMTPGTKTSDDHHVLTLDEIGALAAEGGKPAETLMNVVALIARRFKTDVCSAYLLEPDRANLVLAATLGLRPQCIGTLRLALHEGLTGLVAEQVRPVAVEQVKNHPRFKYFGESGEDRFQPFLGVPLIDRGVLQGVLVVQTIEPRAFRKEEIRIVGRRSSSRAAAPGAAGTPVFSARVPWPISRPSSDCTNPFPSIPAAWEFSPGTISRAPRTSIFRSSASVCFTARATSGSAWTA